MRFEPYESYPLAKVPMKTHIPFGDLVALLLEGKLHRVYYDPGLKGLSSIFVDPLEARSHFEVGREWMLADEAAELIDVEIQIVQLMTREGVLAAHKLKPLGYNPTTMFLVRNEVERFHSRYASASNLAAESNLNAAKVAQRLRNAELDKVRAGQVVFYDREAARAALAAYIPR